MVRPSLIALKQWVLDHLDYDVDSRDYHKLVRATKSATGALPPAYNKNLSMEGALRTAISSLSRHLLNHKFAGMELMAKWNFLSMVMDEDEEAIFVLSTALKAAAMLFNESAAKTGDSSSSHHTQVMNKLLEKERHHSSSSSSSSNAASQPPSPPPKPQSNPPPVPYPKDRNEHNAEVLKEYHRRTVARRTTTTHKRKEIKKQKEHRGGTFRPSATRRSWDKLSYLTKPPEAASGAVEHYIIEPSHPKSPRPVHGLTLGAAAARDPDHNGNFNCRSEYLHSSPNNVKVGGRAWGEKVAAHKGVFFADDEGTFGKPHPKELAVVVLHGRDALRKRDIYEWILRLGIDVEPSVLGLEEEKKATTKTGRGAKTGKEARRRKVTTGSYRDGVGQNVVGRNVDNNNDVGRRDRDQGQRRRHDIDNHGRDHDHHHHHHRHDHDHAQHSYSKRLSVRHYHHRSNQGDCEDRYGKKYNGRAGGRRIAAAGTVATVRAAKSQTIRSLQYALASPLQNGTFISQLAAAVLFNGKGDRDTGHLVKCIEPHSPLNDGKKSIFVIKGTELRPKNRAQAVHNVEAALKVFIDDGMVDGEALFRGTEVVEGNMNAAWDLLFSLFDAYKHLGGGGVACESGANNVKPTQVLLQPKHGRDGLSAKGGIAVKRKHNGAGGGKSAAEFVLPTEEDAKEEEEVEDNKEEKEKEQHDKERRPTEHAAGDELEIRNTHASGSAPSRRYDYKLPSPPRRWIAQQRQHKATTSDESGLLLPTAPLVSYIPPDFSDLHSTELRKTKSFPCATKQQVYHVKLWLHRLGINAKVESTEKKHTVLSDSYRNGVLLCDILALLEPELCQKLNLTSSVCRNPDNIEEASFNVRLAFGILSQTKHTFSPRLIVDPQATLAGDSNAIFSLLWEMMQLYPHLAGFFVLSDKAWFHASKKCHWLCYTPQQRLRLEQSIVHWLIDCGCLQKLGLFDRSEQMQFDIDHPNDYTTVVDALTGRMKETR